MADFKKGFKKVMIEEGLGIYTNIKGDNGGETISGVARKMHPNWAGWALVDAAKKLPNFPASLKINVKLQALVELFYYNEFWLKVGGDKIKSDQIAIQLFDTAVNMGITTAIKLAQSSISMSQTGIYNVEFVNKLNEIIV